MATTEFTVNNALSNKLWSKDLKYETLKETWIKKFIGDSSDSLIYRQDELESKAGDRITYGLRMQMTGAGVQGDATLEGNEESLSFYDDSLYVNQVRNATKSQGKMSEQRVPYKMRNEAKKALADWNADRLDTCFFNQIAGNTAQTSTLYTGNQAATAPDSDHWIWGGNATTDATLNAGDEFTLNIIDRCRERATTLSSPSCPIRPLRINGEDYYVMFLHPYQVYDLRTSTATLGWGDIQKAALSGGETTKNPLFTGALGVYNKTILHESTRIPNGINAGTNVAISSTRRAVFCGAQAAAIAFAGGTEGATGFTWREQIDDYENQLGIGTSMIFGIKKCVFNGKDFGTIVASTYAVAH